MQKELLNVFVWRFGTVSHRTDRPCQPLRKADHAWLYFELPVGKFLLQLTETLLKNVPSAVVDVDAVEPSTRDAADLCDVASDDFRRHLHKGVKVIDDIDGVVVESFEMLRKQEQEIKICVPKYLVQVAEALVVHDQLGEANGSQEVNPEKHAVRQIENSVPAARVAAQ